MSFDRCLLDVHSNSLLASSRCINKTWLLFLFSCPVFLTFRASPSLGLDLNAFLYSCFYQSKWNPIPANCHSPLFTVCFFFSPYYQRFCDVAACFIHLINFPSCSVLFQTRSSFQLAGCVTSTPPFPPPCCLVSYSYFPVWQTAPLPSLSGAQKKNKNLKISARPNWNITGSEILPCLRLPFYRLN